jgi:hypothetical protein
MNKKEKWHLAALKAWETRRKGKQAKPKIRKVKNVKKSRHLAALKAWETRRKLRSGKEIVKPLLPEDLEPKMWVHKKKKGEYEKPPMWFPKPMTDKQTAKMLKNLKPIEKSLKEEVRHLAALKAWATRKRNTEVEHEIEIHDAEDYNL